MARSGNLDPVSAFRFEVSIISLSLSPNQLITGLTNSGGLSQFARAGFTTCTIPESTTTAIEYRENVDNYSMKKIPGLTRFNDITLTRGVIAPANDNPLALQNNIPFKSNGQNDFYAWVRQVASFNPALAIAQTISGTTRNVILKQSQDFRKDMIIIMRDREGKAARRWFLLDVWPTAYKGGSDLDAMSETNSMESLTLTYEVAFELPNVLGAATELIANIYEGQGGDILGGLL
jgi:phage tail-like protein